MDAAPTSVLAPTAAACAAAVLTAAFGLVVASHASPFDVVRCALVSSGCACAVSFLVVDLDPSAARSGALGGALLTAYQCCLAVAFGGSASAAQALVNCNVAIIAVWTKGMQPDVACACAGLVGCAVYVARH
ncbi:MAG: hypothetical protein VW491_03115 [Gammaproteobacteria bacterium]|jgi:hypothetical protein